MKVLAVAELIWPADSTGGSLATHLHLKRLAQEGAEVTVVGPAAPPGATLVEAQLPTTRPALWLWIAKRRRWLYRLAAQHDVVYIPRYAYPMVDIAHAAGAPAVVHMHGYPTYNSLGIPGDWKLEKGPALLYAALRTAPSRRPWTAGSDARTPSYACRKPTAGGWHSTGPYTCRTRPPTTCPRRSPHDATSCTWGESRGTSAPTSPAPPHAPQACPSSSREACLGRLRYGWWRAPGPSYSPHAGKSLLDMLYMRPFS